MKIHKDYPLKKPSLSFGFPSLIIEEPTKKVHSYKCINCQGAFLSSRARKYCSRKCEINFKKRNPNSTFWRNPFIRWESKTNTWIELDTEK